MLYLAKLHGHCISFHCEPLKAYRGCIKKGAESSQSWSRLMYSEEDMLHSWSTLSLNSLNLAFFVWLAIRLISKLRVTPVPGKAVFLFRAFFPSWRFFDDLADVPQLEFRWSRVGEELGPWILAFETPPFKFSSLVLNPKGNFALANQSLLSQLLSDLSDLQGSQGGDGAMLSSCQGGDGAMLSSDQAHEKIEELTSYRLVKNQVQYQVIRRAREVQPKVVQVHYQFRLQTRRIEFNSESATQVFWEEVLISPVGESACS